MPVINYSVSKVRALIEASLMPGNLCLSHIWITGYQYRMLFSSGIHTWKHSKNVVTVRSDGFD